MAGKSGTMRLKLTKREAKNKPRNKKKRKGYK